MARQYIALVAVLALAGCDLGAGPSERKAVTVVEATTTASGTTLFWPPPTPPVSPTERVVQAIRSCEVKRILFLHDDTTSITYRGGKTVSMRRVDPGTVQRATERRHASDVVIGIE